MEIDKITLQDISIFSKNEEPGIFTQLNLCDTVNGSAQLEHSFKHPLGSIDEIEQVQQTVKWFLEQKAKWPSIITNGTIMVVEKFFTASVDTIPNGNGFADVLEYKTLHLGDYSLVKYSAQHCFDFAKGMKAWMDLMQQANLGGNFKSVLNNIQQSLSHANFTILDRYHNGKDLKPKELLALAHFYRYQYKYSIQNLIDHHAQIDAWCAMAKAVDKHGLTFPDFLKSSGAQFNCKDLYHLLLPTPVKYDFSLTQEQNFLFLTGANMAGKSTFIKAIGSAAYLAHLGMGVPAASLSLTLFDGLLSNINVVDNLVKGESYFYNEVQRIKATTQKITNGKNWLILIDELFKGTNVQDAMKCSVAVIDGFQKVRHSLFILSTHLYEIADDVAKHNNIQFKYFETSIVDSQLSFSYTLKDGVSNDRLGYLILQKEGVVDLLEQI